MKPIAQPAIHPDADLLNAFAEHALSEPERAQILAHMAGCARCREVVFLAHAAADPEASPAAIARPQPRPAWRSAAFARWRIALIPAAALASVAAIVLWVQSHPASRPIETAQLASPHPAMAPALSEKPAAHAPAAAVAPPAALAARPRPDQSARSRANPPKQFPSPAAGTAAGVRARNSDASATPAPANSAGQNPAAGQIHLDGRSAAMARYTPPPPVGASSALTYSPQQPPMMRVSPGPVNPAAPSSANPPPPAPPSPSVVAVHNQEVVSPIDGTAQIAAQSLQQVEVSPQPSDGLPVLRLARLAKLPSGLDTISSAALLNRLVAVDSAGAAFFSQDSGRHWESVFAPWTGKAVEVQAPKGLYRLMPASEDRRRQMAPATAHASMGSAVEIEPKEVASPAPPPSGASTAPPSAAKAKVAPPTPAMLFRLVTDRHEVWVSADGKIWRPQ